MFHLGPSSISISFLASELWQILFTSNLTRNLEIPKTFPDFGQYFKKYVEPNQKSKMEPSVEIVNCFQS